MKRNPLSVLCLSLLLLHIDYSFAKARVGGSSGKGKSTTSSKSSKATSSVKSTSVKSQGGSPRQLKTYPRLLDTPGYLGDGRLGRRGGYSGGYINRNPNNTVLSPRYGGSFGYGGYGAMVGSPFLLYVQQMGMYPSDKSRRFGRSAVMAAAGGAMAGMALGYGLGRFPRPHFTFHSPQEEYYYNHYMYRKYGVKSTDANDYSRDYRFTQPPLTYDYYMESCMKRTDLLAKDQKPTEKVLGFSETVSIVEIGYPALIEQMKAKSCLELYITYSELYMERVEGGAQRLHASVQGLLVTVTGFLMMLLNSNLLRLIH